MYTSFQGIVRMNTVHPWPHLNHLNNYWLYSAAIPPLNGTHSGTPYHLKKHYGQIPNGSHGTSYEYYHQPLETQYWDTENQKQFIPQAKTNSSHHKIQKPSESPIHHHEFHWHHGFPFGQGSGMFPDYYNSNY